MGEAARKKKQAAQNAPPWDKRGRMAHLLKIISKYNFTTRERLIDIREAKEREGGGHDSAVLQVRPQDDKVCVPKVRASRVLIVR
jgi:hypothetical protein